MLGIEFALHLFHVEHGVGVFAVGQVQEPVQVVAAHGVFRGRRLHQFHAADFFLKLFDGATHELVGTCTAFMAGSIDRVERSAVMAQQ